MELKAELLPQLKQLHLSGIGQTLEGRLREAESGQWSYGEFLGRILEDEVERRAQNQLTKLLKAGRVNASKSLESFDWHFNPQISRPQILRLASCEYIRQHRNVLITGGSGVGKSHLSHALAQEACRQGYSVLVVGTNEMLAHLAGGRADQSYERRLKMYLRPDLLVLDEFGLKTIAKPFGADDIYEVINLRYEVGSLIITSNRAYEEWLEWWGNPLLASAGLDRLGHHAEAIEIRGRSYRNGGNGSGNSAKTNGVVATAD
jgi:DNA replication protein DnaC